MDDRKYSSIIKPSGFKKILGKFDVFAMAFGAMIGWGWVIMAGVWISGAGSLGAMAAFLTGGIMVTFVALTFAELTSAIPETGGAHVFSHRAFGPHVSFVCSWSLVLGYVSVVIFEAVTFPTVLQYLFPEFLQVKLYTIAGYDVYLTWLLTGMISAGFVTYLNYKGTKSAARLQNVLTIAIFIIGITLIAAAVLKGDGANMKPLFPGEMRGVFSVLIMTPFMLVGFDVIPQAAEEINVPYREVGKIMIFSIFLAASWYILIILAVSLAMNPKEMDSSILVTADAMKKVFGNSAAMANVLVIGGLAGIITSWNSFFMGGSRLIYSMARTRMLPEALGELHERNRTPKRATILIGVIAMTAPFFGREMMIWVTNVGGKAIVVAYLIVALSFLKLRKSEPMLHRPYRAGKGNMVGYGAVLLCMLMLVLYIPGMPWGVGLSKEELFIYALWSLFGAVLYLNARKRYADFGMRQ